MDEENRVKWLFFIASNLHRCAYHEAGHVVFAYICGRKIDYADIGWFKGQTRMLFQGMCPNDQAAYFVAGSVVESAIIGETIQPSPRDMEKLVKVGKFYGLQSNEIREWAQESANSVVEQFTKRENADAIRAVALALLDKRILLGHECSQIIANVLKRRKRSESTNLHKG